ncbi:MAG: hypothetical protein J4478_00490 [Candidatus Diapherotrites archaeon]|uniref:Transposase n=1 Tax=Candidatus Iainarchaeum sp. TaxID=3101447 RepID=A0A7J4JWL8_9ARCH|nr:hypothetical protein [Candidatus Diapherotrites archaeon]HIH21380.1 hypothetical protein [Candidatus Diapherotrites archaeon]HIH33290.1 hypothetical protein [Candidatus Diapherotrites archaeon]
MRLLRKWVPKPKTAGTRPRVPKPKEKLTIGEKQELRHLERAVIAARRQH